MTTRVPVWPWFGLVVLWTAAFVLACHLLPHPLLQHDAQLSGWANLLSAGRTEVSRSLYGRADVYFHCGVEDIERQAFPGLFGKWFQTIAPTAHRHTADTASLETLPWLRWATEMDPHNINAWLDAAYTADYINNPVLSLKILAEALRYNPHDDRIYAQRGLLLLRQNNFESAAHDFDLALRLLPERKGSDAIGLRQDLIADLKNKTLCEEMLGQRELAIAHLRQCVELEPDRAATCGWLATLERNLDSRADAAQRLSKMLHAARTADPDERHAQ